MSGKYSSLHTQLTLDNFKTLNLNHTNEIEPFSEYGDEDEEYLKGVLADADEMVEYYNELLSRYDWFNTEKPLPLDSKLKEQFTKSNKEDFIKEIKENTYYNESAKTLVKHLEDLGYELLKGSNINGEHYFNLKIGNQILTVSSETIKSLSKGDGSVTTAELFTHFANDIPPILKFYSGQIIVGGYAPTRGSDGGVIGGNYSADTNLVHIYNRSITSMDTSTFKNSVEHELTHRLDNYGGNLYNSREYFYGNISDHPMFTIASEAFSSSTYSHSFKKEDSEAYRTENLSEAMAPLGSALSGYRTIYNKNTSKNTGSNANYLDATTRTTMGDETSYRDYQMINPYMDYIGNYIHHADNPKQIIKFLNHEYEIYKKNNPDMFK